MTAYQVTMMVCNLGLPAIVDSWRVNQGDGTELAESLKTANDFAGQTLVEGGSISITVVPWKE